MNTETAKIVVLAALPLEYNAIRAHLADVRRHAHSRGTQFEVGTHRPSGGRVALVDTDAGNLRAAVLAERAIETFRPRAMLLVGIAGAIHDDLELGDVVVAKRVYLYHSGREQDDGFHARPVSREPDHELWGRAKSVARTFEGRVHFRPIAAGEVLLTTRTSSLAKQIDRHYEDAAAIDMESAGAALAGHLGDVKTLIIRGISDRADKNKEAADREGSQQDAAGRAAAFAFALITDLLAEPDRGRPPGSSMSGSGDGSSVQTIVAASGGTAYGAQHGNVHIYPFAADLSDAQ